jgi:hypothetical protein
MLLLAGTINVGDILLEPGAGGDEHLENSALGRRGVPMLGNSQQISTRFTHFFPQ